MQLFIFLIFTLIVLSALFSGSESALFSLSPSDLELIKQKNPAYYKKIKFFIKNNNSILISILIGNLLVNIGASSLSAKVFMRSFPENGLQYSVLTMTVLIIIFGEILPKTYAVKNNFGFIKLTLPMITACYYLFLPFHHILNRLTELIVQSRVKPDDPNYSIDDVQKALEFSHESGQVSAWEKTVASHLLELESMRVSEIMVPRVKVIGLDIEDQPITEIWNHYNTYRLKKIPIYKQSLENIQGIIYIKDIIGVSDQELADNYQKYLRSPFYVPETKRVHLLLQEFRSKQKYFAITIDEYGSVSGIITMNRILSSFIEDVIPVKSKDIYQLLDNNKIIVSADISLDKFNVLFQTNLEDDYYESLGGYLMNHIHKIPKNGEIFKINSLVFTIVSALPNKILKLKVKKI